MAAQSTVVHLLPRRSINARNHMLSGTAMIETIGIILGILGVIFAFEPPRRSFIGLFRKNVSIEFLKEAIENTAVDEKLTEAGVVERQFDLQRPDESWGKPIAKSSGYVIFYDHFKGRLAGRATLVGLVPTHTYVLTINGRPGRTGNEKLRKQYGVEGYHDFLEVKTDAQGVVNNVPFQIDLAEGEYDLKFFVKDKDDWKVVLHDDFLFLTVE